MASTELYTATDSSQESEEKKYYCKYYSFTIFIAGVVLTVIGCFGNTVTSWLLWSDRKKSATFFLLLCIIICDSLFLGIFSMIWIPTNVSLYIDGESKQYALITLVHHLYIGDLHQTAMTSKMYLTICVSLQRYLSTCHPLRSKQWGTIKLARFQLVASVVISFVVWFPAMVTYRIAFGPDGYPKGVPLLKSNTFQVLLSGYQSFFIYIFPMISLAILSFLLLRGLKAAHKKRAALKREESRNAKHSHQISLMIAVLMLMVLINQGMFPSRRILGFFYDSQRVSCVNVFFFFDPWIAMVQTITASMSFFLCQLTIKKYRKKTLAAFSKTDAQNSVAPSGSWSTEAY
jgi:hypothetical protein